MSNQAFAIGIDIGGTTTKCGIVNHRGTIDDSGSVLATAMYSSPDAFVGCHPGSQCPGVGKENRRDTSKKEAVSGIK